MYGQRAGSHSHNESERIRETVRRNDRRLPRYSAMDQSTSTTTEPQSRSLSQHHPHPDPTWSHGSLFTWRVKTWRSVLQQYSVLCSQRTNFTIVLPATLRRMAIESVVSRKRSVSSSHHFQVVTHVSFPFRSHPSAKLITAETIQKKTRQDKTRPGEGKQKNTRISHCQRMQGKLSCCILTNVDEEGQRKEVLDLLKAFLLGWKEKGLLQTPNNPTESTAVKSLDVAIEGARKTCPVFPTESLSYIFHFSMP